MKSIVTQSVIEGIRARKDGSLGLSISTPELTVDEKAIFLELQGIAVDLTITPVNEPSVPEYKVNKDLEQKTPSQRLRSSLYVLWTQKNDGIADFDVFYKKKMEKLIEYVQNRIDD